MWLFIESKTARWVLTVILAVGIIFAVVHYLESRGEKRAELRQQAEQAETVQRNQEAVSRAQGDATTDPDPAQRLQQEWGRRQ